MSTDHQHANRPAPVGGGRDSREPSLPARSEFASDPAPRGTFNLISLGCPKNLIDSECMAGLLTQAGYRMVDTPEGADFVLINTCAFIAAAREESEQVIAEMVDLKARRRLGGIIVAGCLPQREAGQLLERHPLVDRALGVFARDRIIEVADSLVARGDGERLAMCDSGRMPACDALRLRVTPPHVAYLRIAEGCDRTCSFCTIPSIRGPYRSKPIEQVLAEAERLIETGVKELVIVAQDTSYYGFDLYGKPRLAELLARLDSLPGLAWIRLMYLYPTHITEELIGAIASLPRVLPYLDLPLQHIDDTVLRRMRRAVTRAQIEKLLDRLRQAIDGLVLRTTFIVGFPGETKQQFNALLRFTQQQRFERLGVFCYSDEPGTPAATLDGKVPQQTINRRRQRLMAAQQQVAFAFSQSQVGKQLEVIIDATMPDAENAYLGRTWADAPEIDAAVYITGQDLQVGQIVRAEIVAARGYDLIAVAGTALRGDDQTRRPGGSRSEGLS